MSITLKELEQIGRTIGIEDLKEKMNSGNIEMESILISLNQAIEAKNKELEEKRNLLSKCSGALTELRIENERLKESKGLQEETLNHVQNLLKDFNIKSRLATGEVDEDQIIKSLLNYFEKQPVSSFARLQLKEINYKFEESECYESIISKLVSQIKSKDTKIEEQKNQLNYIEVRLKDGQEAIKRIEKEYPGIFDVANEQYVVEQGYINFDGAVDSLLKKCKELEQRQAISTEQAIEQMETEAKPEQAEEKAKPAEKKAKPAIKIDADTVKVMELLDKGYTKKGIIEASGIGRNKVYRICRELGR